MQIWLQVRARARALKRVLERRMGREQVVVVVVVVGERGRSVACVSGRAVVAVR